LFASSVAFWAAVPVDRDSPTIVVLGAASGLAALIGAILFAIPERFPAPAGQK
jgi:hypothetical protein